MFPTIEAMTSQAYTRAAALPQILTERIVVLDGAMGTMIQRHRLGEADYRGERFADHPKSLKGNNDLLQVTRPDVIAAIHEQYLAAGADIIETNTFGATSVAQADYDLGAFAREINVAGARLARAACDRYSSADARAVVDAVVKLAQALGLKVVAEGVETEAQHEILRALGCHELQGFLFARPMSAMALSAWAMDDDGTRGVEFRDSLYRATVAGALH